MNAATINRILATDIDYDAPSAAMQLAWSNMAQERWSRRDFSAVTPQALSESLRFAWKTVKKIRENRRIAKLANECPEIHRLRVERKMLFNKSAHVSIKADIERIDRKIAAISAMLK